MLKVASDILPLAGAQPRSRVEIDRGTLIQYGLAILATIMVVGPIIPILYQSFIDRPIYESGQTFTFANYANLVESDIFWPTVWNTVGFAVASSVIGTLLGVVSAVLIGRTDLPGRRLFNELMVWPIFVSHLVIAFGWLIVYGPAGYLTVWLQTKLGFAPWNLYTIPGMAVVASVTIAPLTFLYCVASGALAQGTLEDAARVCGAGPVHTLWKVTLPLLLPAIAYSFLLNFTGALEMLAIPLVFGDPSGIHLFTTLLYDLGFAAARPDYGIVSTAALILLLSIVILLVVQKRLFANSQRFVTLGGKASRPRTLGLGALRWPVSVVMAIYVLLAIVVPVAALFLRSMVSVLSPLVPFWNYFSWKSLHEVFYFQPNVRSIVNTVIVSALGAAIGTVFAALIAIIVQRSNFRFRGLLEYIALFPRAIPGLVAGMGIFYAMAAIPAFGWIRSTIWVLIAAFIIRFIPLAFGTLSSALMQLGRELDNSARVVGADWWRTTRSIVLPLMRPALFSSYTLLFVYFLKEYTAVVFLFTPGNEVLGGSLLLAWNNGDMGLVSAFSALQILLAIAFVFLARVILKVKIYA